MSSTGPADAGDSSLLEVHELRVEFASPDSTVHALRGVSFTLERGDILGIVGESGCGKSTTARALLGLIDRPGKVTGGSIHFRGRDLLELTGAQWREVRGGQISMVFQDPNTSLNPVLTVREQLELAMEPHQSLTRDQRRVRILERLGAVGLPEPRQSAERYPHELSGGMRQRVMIAMALCNDPAVIIADEPTAALDVTIQAQILDLLRRINDEAGTAIAFITHNLGVVAELCNRVAVLYAGRVVEAGTTRDVFANPRHPYTRALLGSVPAAGGPRRLVPVAGAPPIVTGELPGCAFADRCPLKMDRCEVDDPLLLPSRLGHEVACWAVETELTPAAGGRS